MQRRSHDEALGDDGAHARGYDGSSDCEHNGTGVRVHRSRRNSAVCNNAQAFGCIGTSVAEDVFGCTDSAVRLEVGRGTDDKNRAWQRKNQS